LLGVASGLSGFRGVVSAEFGTWFGTRFQDWFHQHRVVNGIGFFQLTHLHLSELIVDEPARAIRSDSWQALDEGQAKRASLSPGGVSVRSRATSARRLDESAVRWSREHDEDRQRVIEADL